MAQGVRRGGPAEARPPAPLLKPSRALASPEGASVGPGEEPALLARADVLAQQADHVPWQVQRLLGAGLGLAQDQGPLVEVEVLHAGCQDRADSGARAEHQLDETAV